MSPLRCRAVRPDLFRFLLVWLSSSGSLFPGLSPAGRGDGRVCHEPTLEERLHVMAHRYSGTSRTNRCVSVGL